jgi:hypothetical protein
MLSQGTISNTLATSQLQAYNQAVMSNQAIHRWSAPRVSIEIDRVTNGYVMAMGSERMIAKDLEELQAQFIAQVVGKLVLDEAK